MIRPKEDAPLGCALAWFGVLVLVNVAWIGALIWLIVAVVGWLGRH